MMLTKMLTKEDYTKGWIIEPTIPSNDVKYSRPKKIDIGMCLGNLLLFLLDLIGSGLIGMCFGLILLCIK